MELTADTWQVSIDAMTDITSKMLHEKTGQVLDRTRQGERFRVVRDGQPDAFLIPPAESVDPSWDEIMAEVRAARKEGAPKIKNPILAERRKRDYAARVR